MLLFGRRLIWRVDLSTGPTSILGLLTAEIIEGLSDEYDVAAIANAVAFMVSHLLNNPYPPHFLARSHLKKKADDTFFRSGFTLSQWESSDSDSSSTTSLYQS